MGKTAKVILFSLLILAAFVSCKDESGFTVTFNANGGTGEMQQQSFAAGQTASLKANAFTRDKYIFTSWNTKADGSGSSYNDCALVTVSGDMTLYAQWAVRGVSITFDSNNGSGETSSQVVPLNTPATLRANTFQNADYGFACWNTRADGSGTSFYDCAQIEAPQKMTLYAQWGVLLTDDMEEWKESTYILNSDVTINYRVYIKNSDLRLILHDGYTLKANKGINVMHNASLIIDADGEGTGCVDAEADSGHAAIGGNGTVPSGIIIINGGIIEADSDDGAGIGSGNGGTVVSVTINGGEVTASSTRGAGIGGGENSPGCPVTINGGTVTASSTSGAGIGGGNSGTAGPVTINGGTVTASSTSGAGIGGGHGGEEGGDGGTVTINNGTINATSTSGAGIGGGEGGDGGSLIITDGHVDTFSEYGVGIGRGYSGTSDGALDLGTGVSLIVSDDNSNWFSYDGTRKHYMKTPL